MCRITLTTEGLAVAEKISHLQRNGGTLPPEYCEAGGCAVGMNRFTVTSSTTPHGEFPLKSDRYLLAFNGEVYGFRERAFVDEPQFPSDGHFAMDLLHQHGIQGFLSEADLQGTFLIFDKQQQEWWCAVDQMNVAGCFYAEWDDRLIVASEAAPIHQLLKELDVDWEVPIELLSPGQALVRSGSGECRELLLRPHCEELFGGEDEDDQAFDEFSAEFSASLIESVRRRIPLHGPVGILCSGGIDSGVILAITADLLRKANQMDRLKIFTLSAGADATTEKKQDEIHTRLLLDSLGLDPSKFLQVISAPSLEPLNRQLYQEYVFGDFPRLITPHPILRSQVRNAVVMSSLLCAIQADHPDVTTLLTGDGADELLAGYNEMVLGKRTADEVRQEIVTRVTYFPMTDGARVALASFFGAAAARWLGQPDAQAAPIEIRSPFTSHLFMEALAKAHPDFLFGNIDDVRCIKFPLRLLGISLKLPREIILREKMPFNEGATGEKNGVPSELEQSVVLEFMNKEGLVWNGPELNATRSFYNFPVDKPTSPSDLVPGLTDQMVVFFVAEACGAERLFMSRIFQNQPSGSGGGSTAYFPSGARHVDLG